MKPTERIALLTRQQTLLEELMEDRVKRYKELDNFIPDCIVQGFVEEYITIKQKLEETE